MSIKNELNNISYQIRILIGEYVIIHDEVFKFSWRKIIPLPFVFKATDYKDLQDRISYILYNLEKCNENLIGICSAALINERQFANYLSEYCIVLIKTVYLFKEICYQLYLKSENSGDYNFSKHKHLTNEYDEACEKYCEMGVSLEKLYNELNG